jgi:hypothetical protein
VPESVAGTVAAVLRAAGAFAAVGAFAAAGALAVAALAIFVPRFHQGASAPDIQVRPCRQARANSSRRSMRPSRSSKRPIRWLSAPRAVTTCPRVCSTPDMRTFTSAKSAAILSADARMCCNSASTRRPVSSVTVGPFRAVLPPQSASAPEMISISSLVICAWRWRL